MMNYGISELFKRKSFEIFWYEEEMVCQSTLFTEIIWAKSSQSATEEQKIKLSKDQTSRQTLRKLSSMETEN